MERQLEAALRRCDACGGSYAKLCAAFAREVQPLVEELLQLPLRKLPRDEVVPDECSPQVTAVREYLNGSSGGGGDGNGNTAAGDDVWLFLYRCASTLLERLLRKRTRHDVTHNNSNNSNKATSASAQTTCLTNCFVLFCNRGLPRVAQLTLRWSFLTSERARFEASDAYVHANAAERRRLQLHSVLAVFAERAHRHHFTALWTTCIAHMDAAALHVHLLHRLGSTILPGLTNPLVVADYLAGCFGSGGVVAVLALQGLFILMLDHGLEYPLYYEQLYSLVTPTNFASRHRATLFRLLDVSMCSLRVPAYVVASFVKRVARVALLAPAPTLYFALPFLRKLLQLHPNCLALIHRSTREAALAAAAAAATATTGTADHASASEAAVRATAALFDGVDVYDGNAALAHSHALHSTLWELTALERHFLHTVPLMVAAYSSTAEDNTPLRTTKTYARLFTSEVTRPLDAAHVPTVAYDTPRDTSNDLIHL